MTKTIDRTKVVVRRLPPYLKEDAFKIQLDKVAESNYNWYRFSQGKSSTKRTTYSRAYVNFVDAKAVADFKSKFDGFVFVGQKGTQYKCVIEYAPYQRLPKQKSKHDRREGTIEQDPDYLEFLESLEKPPVMLPSAQRQYEEEQAQKQAMGEGEDGIVTTPLMEYIINQYLNKNSSKSNAKDKKESRSNGRGHRSKNKSNQSKSPTPKVLLKTRPTAQTKDVPEKTKKQSRIVRGSFRKAAAVGSKSKRNVKVREGHQAYVPKAMRTGMHASDDTEASTNDHTKQEDIHMPSQTNKSSDTEARSHHRGRGRHRRGHRGNGSRSSQAKVVWVPKAEKQGGE